MNLNEYLKVTWTENGVSPRQTNLASLIEENAIDESVRIPSLNGWSKIEPLGNGAFGEVWKYATPVVETPVVAGKHVKVRLLNLSLHEKAELAHRVNTFVKELNVLRKVSSACPERLVQFIGCYIDGKKLILFLEYMPNGSIKDHIIDQGPLNETIALKYAYQVTQGLHFLHHYQGGRIVHRDVKCDNLLLTSNNDVKLADFGLAYDLLVDNQSHTLSQSAPNDIAGAIFFAAPEVLRKTKYGRRADIWSLGCALVEMLTGDPPHAEFCRKHGNHGHFYFLEKANAEPEEQLQYIGHQLVPHASEPVQKLLDCLFVKDKLHRPRSEDILSVFIGDASGKFEIDLIKLDDLKRRINEDGSATQ